MVLSYWTEWKKINETNLPNELQESSSLEANERVMQIYFNLFHWSEWKLSSNYCEKKMRKVIEGKFLPIRWKIYGVLKGIINESLKAPLKALIKRLHVNNFSQISCWY